MIRRLSILIFLLSCLGNSFAQLEAWPPTLTAASVVNGNEVRLNWENPTDFTVLIPQSYKIYRSNSLDGPFEFIQDTAYAVGGNAVFTDVTANANLGEKYYFVTIEYFQSADFEESVPSNVVASIHLELLNVNGTAVQLDWNVDNITEGSGQGIADHFLDKRIDGGPWLLGYSVGDMDFNSFFEKINDCHLPDPDIFIEYRFRVVHPSGLIAYSNIKSGNFLDLNPPENPVLETISIDPVTEILQLYWNPSLEADVGGYRIQYLENNQELFLDEIIDPLASNYEALAEPANYNSAFQVVTYYVLPFDICLPNYGGLDPFDPQTFSTMLLESSYNDCDQSIQLNWTPYFSWEAGVASYEVSAFIDGAAAVVLGEDITSTSYTLENVQQNAEYLIYVTAICNDSLNFRNSNSNKIKEVTEFPDVAEEFGIDYVTVVADNETEILMSIDQGADIFNASYRLEKLNEFGDGFEPLVTFPQAIADVDGKFTFRDFDVENDVKGDVYRLVALDFCGNVVGITLESSTLHLEVFPQDDSQENTLTWNQYEFWEDGVQEYRVYFSHDKNMPVDPKFVMDSDAFFKIDDIDEFFQSESDFCYRLDAIKRTTIGNPVGAVSQSNVKCTNHQPLFFLPNAMVINGQNPVFKPEGGFIDFTTYEMAIYNRWGTLLFETNSFFEGWDGSYNGEFVRDGAYAYFIKYREGDGKEKFKSGVLTVLRAF